MPAALAWRACPVRFLAGGRAEQTPTHIHWDGAWRAVRLLAEERHEGPVAGGPRSRRLLLADEGGRRFELRGPDATAGHGGERAEGGGEEGAWRARPAGA